MDNMTKKITIIGIGAVVTTAIISIAQTVVKIVPVVFANTDN